MRKMSSVRLKWRLGCFCRDARGATAVEFALVGTPFLLTLFAILEVALIFFGSSALESGVQEAARTIRTRELQLSGGGLEEFRQNVCDQANGLIACDTRLNVDVRTYPTFAEADLSPPVDEAGNPVAGQFAPGGPEDVVVVRVYYVWEVYTPALGMLLGNIGSTNSRLLLSTAAFRNEPL